MSPNVGLEPSRRPEAVTASAEASTVEANIEEWRAGDKVRRFAAAFHQALT